MWLPALKGKSFCAAFFKKRPLTYQATATQFAEPVPACFTQNVLPTPPFKLRKVEPAGAETALSGEPRPMSSTAPVDSVSERSRTTPVPAGCSDKSPERVRSVMLPSPFGET